VLPTEGYTLSLQLGGGFSRSNVADDGPFTRAYGRLTVYRPLGRRWFAQARAEAGQVVARAGVRPPESQLFRAGGDESVRGYDFRSLGPQRNGVVGSGRVLATVSAELARPFSADLPSVWGAVFVDLGTAADSFAALRPALGSGVGVRWRSPVGPLRVDWAWGRDVGKARLHFSVGIAF
jgi:translocation and assembly module TamA